MGASAAGRVPARPRRDCATEQLLPPSRFLRLPAAVGHCHASPSSSARRGKSRSRIVSRDGPGTRKRQSHVVGGAQGLSEILHAREYEGGLAAHHCNRHPLRYRAHPLSSGARRRVPARTPWDARPASKTKQRFVARTTAGQPKCLQDWSGNRPHDPQQALRRRWRSSFQRVGRSRFPSPSAAAGFRRTRPSRLPMWPVSPPRTSPPGTVRRVSSSAASRASAGAASRPVLAGSQHTKVYVGDWRGAPPLRSPNERRPPLRRACSPSVRAQLVSCITNCFAVSLQGFEDVVR